MADGNPYQAPESLAGDDYFADDITQLPFAGLYRAISSEVPFFLALPAAAGMRLRGYLKMPLAADNARGPVGTGRLVPPDAVPDMARRVLQPRADELSDFGFSMLAWERDNVIGNKEQFSVQMLDAAEQALATLEWFRVQAPHATIRELSVEFNSFGREDPEILTGRVRQSHVALARHIIPDFVDGRFFADSMSLEDVFDRHVDRIEQRSVERISPETALERLRTSAGRRFAFVRKIGLLRRISDSEARKLLKQEMD